MGVLRKLATTTHTIGGNINKNNMGNHMMVRDNDDKHCGDDGEIYDINDIKDEEIMI